MRFCYDSLFKKQSLCTRARKNTYLRYVRGFKKLTITVYDQVVEQKNRQGGALFLL